MNLIGRLAWRELRAGIGGFRVFLACLALGVAAIAAIGSLGSAVDAGLKGDARALLGGDLEFHLFHRQATDAERAYLARLGAISEAADMRAMARASTGEKRSLIQLKAVDAAYPLYGEVALAGGGGLARALAFRDGHWGAVAAPGLFDRLGARPGDLIRIGNAQFELRAVLAREPDALGAFIELGPKVTIALPALRDTGLIQPGTLVGYSYRLKLASGDAATIAARAGADLPEAGWRIRQFSDAAPSLQRLLDRLAVFMTLVGLTALLVGGVGIGNATRAYLDEKLNAIATLKCLGAPQRVVFGAYLAQLMALALGGIALGLAVGAAAPFAAAPFLAKALPVAPRLGLYAAPLGLAALEGLLATLAFTLWPLAQAVEADPASLFRSLVAPPGSRPPPYINIMALAALCALALAALAVIGAADRVTAAWFVAGAVLALAAFRLLAGLLTRAARAIHARQAGLRLALANLDRPGAPTSGVIASLGLGLSVLVAIVLVHGSLAAEVDETLPRRAPSFFFIDIQPDQVADFDRLLAAMPKVEETARVPSLRGRIMDLNGTPVEQAKVAPEAEWALRTERGLTYAATPPQGSRVIEGSWWKADYKGPPLLSLDANLARGMGLKLGDTMTVNVLGRDLTATIVNLREIDWTSLGLNFALVLSPGSLDGAPQTFIATARTDPDRESALAQAVTDRFANVSALSVRDVLATVSQIIAAIAAALTVVAGVAIAAGVLVLAGAIAAGRRRRLYESVVLKVLGASRRRVLAAYLLEYGLLGCASAALAGAIGTLAAWLILTRVIHAGWSFAPGSVLLTLGLSVLAILALGYAGTWRALSASAAPLLRNE